jgi:hypothetical protein
MKKHFLVLILSLAPVMALSGNPPHVKGTFAMNTATASVPAAQQDSARDFDFLFGKKWKIHNKRLKDRLKGSKTWEEFEATCVARPILNGMGNEDEFRTEFWPNFVGMAFRFYNPATRTWAIYWADSRRGLEMLDPPVRGRFVGNRGVFEGPDMFEGRPIIVHYIWSRVDTPNPRWEQAFSEDGGKTWETNWIMDFTRAD